MSEITKVNMPDNWDELVPFHDHDYYEIQSTRDVNVQNHCPNKKPGEDVEYDFDCLCLGRVRANLVCMKCLDVQIVELPESLEEKHGL